MSFGSNVPQEYLALHIFFTEDESQSSCAAFADKLHACEGTTHALSVGFSPEESHVLRRLLQGGDALGILGNLIVASIFFSIIPL